MRLRDHIEKLNYYVAAIENNSLRKAAETARIGQPQMTRVIMQLEDLLQVPLLIRSRQGVTPTPEGLKLYHFAKKLLDDTDKFEFVLHSREHKLKGKISIGAYDSISRYFFPGFMNYLKNLAPELEVELRIGRSADLVKQLKKGELELAVFVGEAQASNLKSEIVYSDYFGFYQAKSLEGYFSNTLISFPGAVQGFEALAKKNHFSLHHDCENLETVVNLAVAGMGVGLLPTRVAQEHVAAGKLVECRDLNREQISPHHISVAFNKKKNKPAAQFLYNEIFRFLNIWSKK